MNPLARSNQIGSSSAYCHGQVSLDNLTPQQSQGAPETYSARKLNALAAPLFLDGYLRDTAVESGSTSRIAPFFFLLFCSLRGELARYIGQEKVDEAMQLLEQLQKWEKRFFVFQNTPHRPVNLILDEIAEELFDLPVGKKHLFRSGGDKHAFLLLFERGDNAHFHITLVNTGAGIHYHPHIRKEKLVKYGHLCFQNVPEEALALSEKSKSLFVQTVFLPVLFPFVQHATTDEIYQSLFLLLKPYVSKALQEEEGYFHSQKDGTCASQVMVRWLMLLFPVKSDYKQVQQSIDKRLFEWLIQKNRAEEIRKEKGLSQSLLTGLSIEELYGLIPPSRPMKEKTTNPFEPLDLATPASAFFLARRKPFIDHLQKIKRHFGRSDAHHYLRNDLLKRINEVFARKTHKRKDHFSSKANEQTDLALLALSGGHRIKQARSIQALDLDEPHLRKKPKGGQNHLDLCCALDLAPSACRLPLPPLSFRSDREQVCIPLYSQRYLVEPLDLDVRWQRAFPQFPHFSHVGSKRIDQFRHLSRLLFDAMKLWIKDDLFENMQRHHLLYYVEHYIDETIPPPCQLYKEMQTQAELSSDEWLSSFDMGCDLFRYYYTMSINYDKIRTLSRLGALSKLYFFLFFTFQKIETAVAPLFYPANLFSLIDFAALPLGNKAALESWQTIIAEYRQLAYELQAKQFYAIDTRWKKGRSIEENYYTQLIRAYPRLQKALKQGEAEQSEEDLVRRYAGFESYSTAHLIPLFYSIFPERKKAMKSQIAANTTSLKIEGDNREKISSTNGFKEVSWVFAAALEGIQLPELKMPIKSLQKLCEEQPEMKKEEFERYFPDFRRTQETLSRGREWSLAYERDPYRFFPHYLPEGELQKVWEKQLTAENELLNYLISASRPPIQKNQPANNGFQQKKRPSRIKMWNETGQHNHVQTAEILQKHRPILVTSGERKLQVIHLISFMQHHLALLLSEETRNLLWLHLFPIIVEDQKKGIIECDWKEQIARIPVILQELEKLLYLTVDRFFHREKTTSHQLAAALFVVRVMQKVVEIAPKDSLSADFIRETDGLVEKLSSWLNDYSWQDRDESMLRLHLLNGYRLLDEVEQLQKRDEQLYCWFCFQHKAVVTPRQLVDMEAAVRKFIMDQLALEKWSSKANQIDLSLLCSRIIRSVGMEHHFAYGIENSRWQWNHQHAIYLNYTHSVMGEEQYTESDRWSIDLGKGWILRNDLPMVYTQSSKQIAAFTVYKRFFGDEPLSWHLHNKTWYTTTCDQIRFRCFIHENNLVVQRHLDSQWYQLSDKKDDDSQTLSIPTLKPVSYWLSPEQDHWIIIDDRTQQRIATLYRSGEWMTPSGEQVAISPLATLFSRFDHWKFQQYYLDPNTKQVLKLFFVRYRSLNDTPLSFVPSQQGWHWQERPQYRAVQTPCDSLRSLLYGMDGAICLQDNEQNQRILIPLRKIDPKLHKGLLLKTASKWTTTDRAMDRDVLFYFVEWHVGTNEAMQPTLFSYSVEGSLFLAYQHLHQNRCDEARKQLNRIEKSDRHSLISLQILQWMAHYTLHQSPGQLALQLYAWQLYLGCLQSQHLKKAWSADHAGKPHLIDLFQECLCNYLQQCNRIKRSLRLLPRQIKECWDYLKLLEQSKPSDLPRLDPSRAAYAKANHSDASPKDQLPNLLDFYLKGDFQAMCNQVLDADLQKQKVLQNVLSTVWIFYQCGNCSVKLTRDQLIILWTLLSIPQEKKNTFLHSDIPSNLINFTMMPAVYDIEITQPDKSVGNTILFPNPEKIIEKAAEPECSGPLFSGSLDCSLVALLALPDYENKVRTTTSCRNIIPLCFESKRADRPLVVSLWQSYARAVEEMKRPVDKELEAAAILSEEGVYRQRIQEKKEEHKQRLFSATVGFITLKKRWKDYALQKKAKLIDRIDLHLVLQLLLDNRHEKAAELLPWLTREEREEAVIEALHFLYYGLEEKKHSRQIALVWQIESELNPLIRHRLISEWRQLNFHLLSYCKTNRILPFWIFSYRLSKILRKEQVEDITALLDTPRCLLQREAGLGKTSCYVPLWSFITACQGNLSLFFVHHSQYHSALSLLKEIQYAAFEQAVWSLKDKRENLSIDRLEWIEKTIQASIEAKKLLVIRPETFLLFFLELIITHRHTLNEANKDSAVADKKFRSLVSICNQLISAKGLGDEIDQLIDSKKEVNLSIGEKIPLAQNRIALIQSLFTLLVRRDITVEYGDQSRSLAEIVGLEKDEQMLLEESIWLEHVVPVVASHLVLLPLFNLEQADRNSAVAFLISFASHQTFESQLDSWYNQGGENRERTQLLYLARYLLLELLPSIFKQSVGKNFGRKRVGEEQVSEKGLFNEVCPYFSTNRPSHLVFGNPYVKVVAHFMTVLYKPIDQNQWNALIARLNTRAEMEAQLYGCSIQETPAAKEFEQYTNCNLSEVHDPGQYQLAFENMNRRAESKLWCESYALEEFAFYYAERITHPTSFIQHYLDLAGMSATPWNHREMWNSTFLYDSELDGKMIAHLAHQTSDSTLYCLPHFNDVTLLLDQMKQKLQRQIDGLFDCGPLLKEKDNIDMARDILSWLEKNDPQKRGVLFFHRTVEQELPRCILLLKQEGKESCLPIEGSIARALEMLGIAPDSVFVFLTEGCTTGFDFPFLPSACALILTREDTTLSAYIQTCKRLRLRSQLACTIYPKRSSSSSDLSYADFISLLMQNQAEKEADSLCRAYMQKIQGIVQTQFVFTILDPAYSSWSPEMKRAHFTLYDSFLFEKYEENPYSSFSRSKASTSSLKHLQGYCSETIERISQQQKSINLEPLSSEERDRILKSCSKLIEQLKKVAEEVENHRHELPQSMLSPIAQREATLMQEVEVEMEQQQEMEVYPDIQTEIELELMQYESALLNDREYKETEWWDHHIVEFLDNPACLPFDLLILDKLYSIQSIFTEKGPVPFYSSDFSSLFSSHITMTNNFRLTNRRPVTVFHPLQKSVSQLLVMHCQNVFVFLVLSLREGGSFSDFLHRNPQSNVWLINAEGILLSSCSAPLPKHDPDFRWGLMECNCFGGNMGAILRFGLEPEFKRWLATDKEQKCHFLQLRCERRKEEKSWLQLLIN